MTEITDIEALNRPVRERYDWSMAVWRDCDHCGKTNTGTVTAKDGSSICARCVDEKYWSAWQTLAETALVQLEAERQRADYGQQVIDQRNAECDRLIVELAALRGTQEPVAWTDAEELRDVEKHGCGYLFKIDPANPYTDPRRQIMVYRRQPKPVVVKLPAALMPAIHNSGELFMTPDNVEQGGYLNRDDVTRVLRAAGIVVNEGE